jgi:hypothetical protein
MTIKASVQDMIDEAKALTEWGNKSSIVWEQIDDVIAEVFADAISIEFYVKIGRKVFYTPNQSVFCNVLEWALS